MSEHEQDAVQPQAIAGELSENELEAVAGGGIIDDLKYAASVVVDSVATLVDAIGD